MPNLSWMDGGREVTVTLSFDRQNEKMAVTLKAFFDTFVENFLTSWVPGAPSKSFQSF